MRGSQSSQIEGPIFTIGYEKTDVSSLISRLLKAQIDTLVDIRDLPLSRKKGFSKNSLREALSNIGIDYLHVKVLGDPKLGRAAARAGNYKLFVEIFSNHIENETAQEALEYLAQRAVTNRICLMCFERQHDNCHRKIVAERLSEISRIPVFHLSV